MKFFGTPLFPITILFKSGRAREGIQCIPSRSWGALYMDLFCALYPHRERVESFAFFDTEFKLFEEHDVSDYLLYFD